MAWFEKSLNHKFTVATIAGFFISALVFSALFLLFYQSKLENEREMVAHEVNMLLQTSLENAMLKNDLNGLRFIVKRLGDQTNIRGVMIANPAGRVRFSSTSINMDRLLDKKIILHSHPQTLFMQNAQGIEILRSVIPVRNKVECQQCHGSIEENPVNGILIVDYDASNIRKDVLYTTLSLMGAGALIVIINLLGGWWFIRRFILTPVASLGAASHALAQGELDVRVNLPGQDELSDLGKSFNLMAENLQSGIRELKEGQAFLQAIVDTIPDGLRIIDNEYNTLLVNQAFREQTGCADKNLVGEKCYQSAYNRDEPCPAELITCPLQKIQQQTRPLKLIHHHQRCDGSILDVEIFAAPMTISKDGNRVTLLVESIRDLSQQVSFTHEQHLSELGKLAAGVAHEIYNPLSTMKLAISSLSRLCEKERESSDFSDYLEIVEQEMDDCIQITNRLLRLSATPLDQPELVDITLAIKDILSLVKWEAEKANILVTESFPAQALRVLASQSEIRMLILNLVQNAFHAMPSGGELQITGFEENTDIVLKFSDNGIGIPQKNLAHIFMPFFSRRANNKPGTGLGLSISRAIAQSFNGTLKVESEEGKGSCFIVRLPNADNEDLSS
jgi:PAS domain S-box-containing protein